MYENTVTIWMHGTLDEIWGYACPHPDSITDPDTYVYDGEPYWVKPENINDYLSFCIRHGKSVLIHVGG